MLPINEPASDRPAKRDRPSSSGSTENQPSKQWREDMSATNTQTEPDTMIEKPPLEQTEAASSFDKSNRFEETEAILMNSQGGEVFDNDTVQTIIIPEKSINASLLELMTKGFNDLKANQERYNAKLDALSAGQMEYNAKLDLLSQDIKKETSALRKEITNLKADLQAQMKNANTVIRKQVDQKFKRMEDDVSNRLNSLGGKVEEVRKKTGDIDVLKDRVTCLETMAESNNCAPLS